MKFYILDGKTPVLETDFQAWVRFFQKTKRTIRISNLGRHDINENPTGAILGESRVTVSTIFIGLDVSFNDGEPEIFETMIFGGPLNFEIIRSGTWEQAIKNHELMVDKVRAAVPDLENEPSGYITNSPDPELIRRIKSNKEGNQNNDG